MPYVPVPKDLSRVKNKIAFNLTRRQLVSFALAGAVGIPFYLFSRSTIGTDVAALCMIGLMLPFFAVGMYEKDGQPLEKIVFHYVRARFLWPGVRPFKTHNLYAALERQAQIDKEVRKLEAAGKAARPVRAAKKAGQTGDGGGNRKGGEKARPAKKTAENRRA